jgi:hypothetical protein
MHADPVIRFPILATCPAIDDVIVAMRVQVYVPSTWEDSDPRYIQNAEEVKLRSMSTKVQRHLERTHIIIIS